MDQYKYSQQALNSDFSPFKDIQYYRDSIHAVEVQLKLRIEMVLSCFLQILEFDEQVSKGDLSKRFEERSVQSALWTVKQEIFGALNDFYCHFMASNSIEVLSAKIDEFIQIFNSRLF